MSPKTSNSAKIALMSHSVALLSAISMITPTKANVLASVAKLETVAEVITKSETGQFDKKSVDSMFVAFKQKIEQVEDMGGKFAELSSEPWVKNAYESFERHITVGQNGAGDHHQHAPQTGQSTTSRPTAS